MASTPMYSWEPVLQEERYADAQDHLEVGDDHPRILGPEDQQAETHHLAAEALFSLGEEPLPAGNAILDGLGGDDHADDDGKEHGQDGDDGDAESDLLLPDEGLGHEDQQGGRQGTDYYRFEWAGWLHSVFSCYPLSFMGVFGHAMMGA